jgi:hypothetical protein
MERSKGYKFYGPVKAAFRFGKNDMASHAMPENAAGG